jgi:hypothetical protein
MTTTDILGHLARTKLAKLYGIGLLGGYYLPPYGIEMDACCNGSNSFSRRLLDAHKIGSDS